LTQEFQSVGGTYELSGIRVPVENGVLRGNDIRFTVNGVEYTGQVDGDAMEGNAKGRATAGQWAARRVRE
jgi:hypothetical protein